MANSVICLAGLSNSGKSTSLKYLDPAETFIISCTGNWYVCNDYIKIEKMLEVVSSTRSDIKVIVIDDINYCLSNEIMQNALVKGYEKFTLQAKNYYDLISKAHDLREDLTVVIISHIINDGTDIEPSWKLYSSGKMLDKTVNLDGLFSYIIYAERTVGDDEEVHYHFRTRTNGNDTCRSVEGCFQDKLIEPNMKLVIDTINKFENEE